MVKLRYQVVWDDEAIASLKKVYNYIKKRESPERALKVRNAIKDLGNKLGYMPHKFSKDPFLEGEPGDNRFKALWNYKIVYEVTDEKVIILDVFHTSRNPKDLRKIKEK